MNSSDSTHLSAVRERTALPCAGMAALVTGGSRGIGAAVAVELARQGANVAITYRERAHDAETVVQAVRALGRRSHAVRVDCVDGDAVVRVVDDVAREFGGLDILVNNAAVFLVGDGLDADDLDMTLAVNVRAPFMAAQAAARHMNGGGRIIGIGSNVAVHTPFPGFAMYATSKTALVGMTKGLARDLGPRGITVNLVHPGPTDTETNRADGPAADTVAAMTALGRYAQPSDVAQVVAHLAGDGGRYVTGAQFSVDGGFSV